jgi:drug/metabolite transporter (DMT)-like permease
MTPRLYLDLLLLSAIWGGAFIYTRVLSPNIGVFVTSESRLLLGGLGLGAWFLMTRFNAQWKLYWKRYLAVGLLNTAIPFTLFSYAALALPGSYLAIFNSLSPLWAAVFAAMFTGEPLTSRKIAGFALGVAGVALITRGGPVPVNTQTLIAVGACLAATICYGLGGIFIKINLQQAKPAGIAGGSQLIAGLLCSPALFSGPPTAVYSAMVWLHIAVAGLVCGSVAYLLYYRLVTLAGPVKALSVTMFLNEAITPGMLAGCVTVLAGLALVFRSPPVKQRQAARRG